MTEISMEFETRQGLADQALTAYEAKLGLKFPDDYRAFFLKFNGGSPSPRFFNFKGSEKGSEILGFFGFGSRRDVMSEIAMFYGRLPRRFFPVAADAGGNLICISMAGDDYGKIYFWDHDREAEPDDGESPETVDNITLIADSFDEFLNGLHELEEE